MSGRRLLLRFGRLVWLTFFLVFEMPSLSVAQSDFSRDGTLSDIPPVPVFPSGEYRVVPVTISQVLEQVVNLSPEIRIARRKLDVSYAIRDLAIEGFLPSFTVNGGTMTYSGEVQSSSGLFENVTKQRTTIEQGGVLSTSPGFSGFQTLIKTTRINETRAQLSETINQKTAQAARLYFSETAHLSRMVVLRRAVAISTRILKEEKRLMELGGASIVGVLRAAHEVARDQRALAEEERRTYLSGFRLAQILGMGPNTLPLPREAFILPRLFIRVPHRLEPLLSLSDRNRPLLNKRRLQVTQRQQGINQALYGPLVPTLGVTILNGGLGPDAYALTGYGSTLFFASWTVGPGGILDPAQILLTNREKDLADSRLVRTRLSVHRQVSQSYESLNQSFAEEKIAVSDVRLARLTFIASRKRVRLGVYHALELIISLRDLVHAQLKYVDSTESFLKSQFDLLAATGSQPMLIRTPVLADPDATPDLFRFSPKSTYPLKKEAQ